MTLALLAPSAAGLALAEQFLVQGVDFFPSSEEIDAWNWDIHAPSEENHESTGELIVTGQNFLSPGDQFVAFIEPGFIRYADFSALSLV